MILLTFIIHRGVFIIHHLYSTYTTYSSEKVIPSKYPPHGHSLHHNRWCFFCLTQATYNVRSPRISQAKKLCFAASRAGTNNTANKHTTSTIVITIRKVLKDFIRIASL